MDLDGKVAFITGGASGLGKATAKRFVDAGARVLIFDLNEENAEQSANEFGDAAIHASGDVSDEAAVQAAIDKTVSAFASKRNF